VHAFRRLIPCLFALALLAAPRAVRAQQSPTEEQIGETILMRVQPGGGPEIAIEEILRDVGERLHKVITIDEGLRGKKIRFYTSAEITFNILRAVLQSYEVELAFEKVDNREILHAYLQRNTQTRTGWGAMPFYNADEKLPGVEQVVTAVYIVKYNDPAQIANTIRALMTKDPRRVGNPITIPKSPALIITDFVSCVDFYLKIAKAFDQPTPQFTYKIVQVQYALADELAALINTLQRTLEPTPTGGGGVAGAPAVAAPPAAAPPGGGPRPVGQAAPGQPQVVADVRTNKLVILALPDDISSIEKLIHEMDVKVQPPPRHFHVYKCLNANAADLADRLNQLFGANVGSQFGRGRTGTATGLGGTAGSRPGGFGSTSSLGGSRLGTSTANRPGTNPFGAQPGQTGAAPTPGIAGGPGGAGRATSQTLNPGEMGLVETRIVPDDQTNSLLVQANMDDWNEILEILKQLDKKRLRVIIEAQVWEIDVTDDIFFAVDTAYATPATTNTNPNPLRGQAFNSNGLLAPTIENNAAGVPAQLGLVPNFGQVTGFNSTLQNGGLIVALTKGGFDKIPLIIQALEQKTNANLLTTPFAITNDNEQATFLIEQQAPYQIVNSQVGAGAFQGFDFATATSQLSIIPRISSGNNLTLNIQLDIQSFTTIPPPGQPPASNARSYSGTVTIPNRQYVIFGGLEQESITEKRHTWPLLGDIPYLGYLIGSTDHVKERHRIYVFIRPVIFTDEGFEDERKASDYARTNIQATSLLGVERSQPIIPDDVLDAEVPGPKATLYRLYGDGGSLGMPEDPKTREIRRAATQAR
jgi:general secretion pathway protein D